MLLFYHELTIKVNYFAALAGADAVSGAGGGSPATTTTDAFTLVTSTAGPDAVDTVAEALEAVATATLDAGASVAGAGAGVEAVGAGAGVSGAFSAGFEQAVTANDIATKLDTAINFKFINFS